MMRPAVIALLTACLGLSLTGCEEAELSTERPDCADSTSEFYSGGRLTFESTEYDFGTISPESRNKCVYNFTNTARTPLLVTRVDSCCGVVTRMAKQRYEPAEQGRLELEYYAGKRAGFIKRQISVYSSDPESPGTRLTFQAMIAAKLRCDPESLTLDPRKREVPELSLSSMDNKSFAISKIESTSPAVSLAVSNTEAAPEQTLDPVVDWDSLRQGLTGYIALTTTHPECRSITIPFSVLSVYQANPAIITLFDSAPGRPVERTVWILNNYGEVFDIEKIESQSGHLRLKSRNAIPNGYRLIVEITPPPVDAGRKSFSDSLAVAIADGPTLDISCYGLYGSASPQ